MSATYQYIKIGRPYFCLQQNAAILMWLLYFKNRSLGLGSLGLGRKKALRAVKALVRHQLGLRKNVSVLELPVYGNLCLPVHRGYRVFDFSRKTVTRTFAPEVDPAIILSEIEGVRNASQLDFVPNVLCSNVEEGWYKEDFVIGDSVHLISKSEPMAFLEMYHQNVARCIEHMILLQEPSSVNLGEYIDRLVGILKDDRLSKKELTASKVNTIKRFVESMAEQLVLEGNRQIDLVFSHGDFSLVNILRTKDGIMVIDWESASRRNPLFDLYNYFFTELYYERATIDVVPEVNKAILSLQSRLTLKAPQIARDLSSLAPMYRRLYYLERIVVLLERELTDKVLDVALRSIKVFSHYEDVNDEQLMPM